MSWTFTVTSPEGFTKTAAVRNPEFDDADSEEFRQGKGSTDGGLVYVQDLDQEDEIIQVTWGFLSVAERADLQDFFGRDGTLRQARSFSIDIEGSSFPQKLKAGAIINGAVVKAGEGHKAGDTVDPDVTTLRHVFLDQPGLPFIQERDQRFSLDARFRIHRPTG